MIRFEYIDLTFWHFQIYSYPSVQPLILAVAEQEQKQWNSI